MVGLTSKDIQAKISSRKLLAAVLTDIGIPPERLDPLYGVLDKRAKLPAEAFEAILAEQVPDVNQAKKVLDFMTLDAVEQVRKMAGANERVLDAVRDLEKLFAMLEWMGVGEYCRFDPSIVRGLAYYTGMVFEVHDIAGELRAICGGGRYDNLLRDFGGPSIPATGMGMGDAVLEILLQEKGLLDEQVVKPQLEYFVTFADQYFGSEMYRITAAIRLRGHSANFSYKLGGLSKQLKEAAGQNARACVIVGQEYRDKRQVVLKNMATGEQELADVEQFLSRLGS